jgi:hypothetical protein
MKGEQYWCTEAPAVPRIWSSSSIKTISDCPRRFQYEYVEGWGAAEESLDITFGSFFHSCMEIYWIFRHFEWSHEDAVLHAVDLALQLGTLLPEPKRDSQKAKTKKNLVRAVVWYFDEYEDEISQLVYIKDKPAVEINFSFLLDLINPDGDLYIVQGYLDNLRLFVQQRTCWDYKTTGKSVGDYYLAGFSPNIQTEIYTIGARVYSSGNYTQFMADIIVIQMTGVQFHRHPVYLTPGKLEETLEDIKGWIRLAEDCARREYYPKNTQSCGWCTFHDVCNTDPQLRTNMLRSQFVQKRRGG